MQLPTYTRFNLKFVREPHGLLHCLLQTDAVVQVSAHSVRPSLSLFLSSSLPLFLPSRLVKPLSYICNLALPAFVSTLVFRDM
jgi:hypothetical protein